MSHHTRTQHPEDTDLSGPRSPSWSPLSSRSFSPLANNATNASVASSESHSALFNVDHYSVSAANQQYLQNRHAYPLHAITPITSTSQNPLLFTPLGQVYEDTITHHLAQLQQRQVYISPSEVAIKAELSPTSALLLSPTLHHPDLHPHQQEEKSDNKDIVSASTMPRQEKQRASASVYREARDSSLMEEEHDPRWGPPPKHYTVENIDMNARKDGISDANKKKWLRTLKNRISAHRSRVNKNNRLIAAEAAVEDLTAQLAAKDAELNAALNEIANLRLHDLPLVPTHQQQQQQEGAQAILRERWHRLQNQNTQHGFIESGSPTPILPAPRHQQLLSAHNQQQQQQLDWGSFPAAPQVAPFPTAPQHDPGYVNPAELGYHNVQYGQYHAQ